MSEQQPVDKYTAAIAASKVIEDDAAVKAAVEKILADHFAENNTKEVHTFLFNTIDLTTLSATDSVRSVARFTQNVNDFAERFPSLPNVAAICVYPNFASVVRSVLEVSDVRVACVSGAFPSSQSFEEVKMAETMLARENGADEIDIVFNVGYYLDNDYEAVADEIAEQKESCRGARLKVILETGALKSARNIKIASILSLYSGADFLKTSTGKEFPGASLEAAYVMLTAIKEYYDATGVRVGFKCSGGVSTTEAAVQYYTLVKEILGEEWLTNDYFRIGASRLANNLLSDIVGYEVKQF